MMRIQHSLFPEPLPKIPSKEEILARMKHYIECGVLNKTEVHYKMFLKHKHRISPNRTNQHEFNLIFMPWNSSACYYDVFMEYGDAISTNDYLNMVESKGSYTQRVWEELKNNPSLKPSEIIEKFLIKENMRELIYASGSEQECNEIAQLIIAWNIHVLPQYENEEALNRDTELEFLRKSKPKKGELTSTRCMNGECIGGILTRETAF